MITSLRLIMAFFGNGSNPQIYGGNFINNGAGGTLNMFSDRHSNPQRGMPPRSSGIPISLNMSQAEIIQPSFKETITLNFRLSSHNSVLRKTDLIQIGCQEQIMVKSQILCFLFYIFTIMSKVLHLPADHTEVAKPQYNFPSNHHRWGLVVLLVHTCR